MHVFAYGTLQFPEVVQAVTGRRFPWEPAVLDGYERRRVRGRDYPGIIVARGRHAAGQLYRDVDARSVTLMDRFEGALYERDRVIVTTADGAPVTADVYVVPPSRGHALSAEPWDGERFAAEHLAVFVESCRRFYRREGRR
jgi:gamma-glutamylcyclotransferase (GGCT)/AIG2-like uncharacterized protein YtfP